MNIRTKSDSLKIIEKTTQKLQQRAKGMVLDNNFLSPAAGGTH